jgi:hypothetical protein
LTFNSSIRNGKILTEKVERKRPLGRPRGIVENNIKVVLKTRV